jgi:hypothetical protein
VNILGAAAQLRKAIESSPTTLELAEYEKEVDALRLRMDAAAFEHAWHEGERLSMDEAIVLAVRE